VSFDLIDTLRVRPFRLVVADADEILEVCGRDGALSPVEIDRSRCLMRTSSSVEPGPVAASRARLFETVRSNPSWPAQDAFHAMTDPDRPGFGVSMSRADACTVSMTSVEVFADRVRMAYLPRPGHAPAHVTDLARATY
jgi:hypothetical protein